MTEPLWKILWPADRGATKGDTDRDKLLAAVGFALSKWEELEEALADLFTALIGAKWGEPAVRAYGSVNNFYGRADMLSAAAEAFFHFATFRKKIAGPDALIARSEIEFKDLMKHCRGFSARRNEIAHGKYFGTPEHGYTLRPAAYNSKKYDFEDPWGTYSYTSVEILSYADHFARLTLAARSLRGDIATIAEKIS